jgi:DNA-binding NtrC family response regulator
MPFHIFVVDDEPVIASSLTAILKLNGFSAQYFTTPLDALAALKSNKPDLLVSDVAMPGISGIELAIQVRALYPSCKVLLFSGHAGTVDSLANAVTKGHDFRVLQKPVHPRVMLTKIGALAQDNDNLAS